MGRRTESTFFRSAMNALDAELPPPHPPLKTSYLLGEAAKIHSASSMPLLDNSAFFLMHSGRIGGCLGVMGFMQAAAQAVGIASATVGTATVAASSGILLAAGAGACAIGYGTLWAVYGKDHADEMLSETSHTALASLQSICAARYS